MRKLAIVLFLFCIAFVCNQSQAASDSAEFSIAFRFEGKHRCSSVSPEIQLKNVPAGTVAFNVKMVDKDKPDYKHGGGSVQNDGSGILKEGALDSYEGPCPPTGMHTYEFTVVAVDDKGKTLATAKARKSL